jgi:hypothetical protein
MEIFDSNMFCRPECQPILCPLPPDVKDGHLAAVGSSGSSSSAPPRQYGTVLQLVCRDGHRPADPGLTEIRCGEDGTWSRTALECPPARCVPLQPPLHGEVVFLPSPGSTGDESVGGDTVLLSSGTRAEFSCHEGYQLFGSGNAVCLQNQSWDGVAPQCQSKILFVQRSQPKLKRRDMI